MAKWTAADVPDLSGRTVVVTGGGRGIGLVTARELGRAGARVVLGVRDPDRVVSVTSQLHRMARLDVADLDRRSRPYRPVQAYDDSELAQVLFSLELQRRPTASGSAVRSVLAHPGIARTALVDHSRTRVVTWLGPLLDDVEHAALPVLLAATQDVPGNASVGPDGPGSVKGHPLVRRAGRKGLDAATARRVWAATEELTGVRAAL